MQRSLQKKPTWAMKTGKLPQFKENKTSILSSTLKENNATNASAVKPSAKPVIKTAVKRVAKTVAASSMFTAKRVKTATMKAGAKRSAAVAAARGLPNVPVRIV